jgi:hypothetical protein
MRHFKRTYKQALKRQIASGTYDPKHPKIIPAREDRRYRVRKVTPRPQSKAVIIYMMDVSGSMGSEQKEIVRIETFWIDTWIRAHYKGLVTRYIVHDAVAREVDRDTFYRTRESGGTIISSAYKLCVEMLKSDYDSSEWNVYPFHFSDGDNWSGSDTQECMKILNEQIVPKANVFCYGQVESEYGSGQFLNDLVEKFPSDEKVITSKISSRDAIYGSIKEFLGKGQIMSLSPELVKARDEIREHAKAAGLDFFEVLFEVLDWHQMNVVASYGGFPSRYPHWRFGMEYEHISKSYAYGLTKIYEMVINNDPSYAYLLHSNGMVDQKMVMAHVYGHSDFFKNNAYFAGTNRKMIDEMGNHRSKVMRMINKHGLDAVESFIDCCLTLGEFDRPTPGGFRHQRPDPIPTELEGRTRSRSRNFRARTTWTST